MRQRFRDLFGSRAPSRHWRRGGILLLIVWVTIAIGVWNLHRGKPTASEVLRDLSRNPLEKSLSPDHRKAWIIGLSERLKQLEKEDRLRVLLDEPLRQSLSDLSEQERAFYLEQTRPPGWAEMLKGFRNATIEKRLRSIDVALNDLDQLQPGTRQNLLAILDQQAIATIVQEGFESYFARAGLGKQIRLQPLLERIQAILQVSL